MDTELVEKLVEKLRVLGFPTTPAMLKLYHRTNPSVALEEWTKSSFGWIELTLWFAGVDLIFKGKLAAIMDRCHRNGLSPRDEESIVRYLIEKERGPDWLLLADPVDFKERIEDLIGQGYQLATCR